MRKSERLNKINVEINMVPFTDVVLVLLVIFMVTTPMIVQGQIKVRLPKARAQSEAQLRPLVVTLSAQGRVFLGDQEVSLNDLGTLLTPALKERADKQLVINADRSVAHGRVVAILDIARASGAEKLAIATENDNAVQAKP